jgi:DNA-binding NtrC family response regulator
LQKLLAVVGRAVKTGHAAALPHPQPAAPSMSEPRQETLQWPQAALGLPYREARLEFERAYFLHVLAREGGNMSQVAQRTGIERTHLYRKFHLLGLRSMRRA